MKNYENRLKAIKRLADSKTAKVVFLDFRNGKYYQGEKEVDISTVKANVILIDDIPDTPPEFLEKGSDEDWQENESVTKE